MACQLYTENDLSALYSLIYGEIMDRIQDPKLGKFDNKALDKFINEVYEEFKDEPNGLLYVQAIPDVLDIVKNDLEVKTYLRKEAGLSFDYVQDLSLDFEDLDNVLKFVTPKVTKPTKKQVNNTIKKSNKNSKNVVQNNNNNQKGPWSAVQEKAKVDYPDKTSGQIAVAKNPETMTEEERNAVDSQKKLFDKVVKTTIWASRNRTEDDKVMLGDTPIMLKAQSIRSLDPADLTDYDISFLSKNKNYDINVAIISDEQGNIIRFDEDGNIVETGGRIVYQYIRPVVKRNGRLYLGNRSGFLYTLVEAQKLAQREIEAGVAEGKLYNEKEREAVLARIKQEQTQKMNDLLALNEKLSTGEPVMMPVTGGSYGIVESKSELLSKTDFANDLEMIYTHDSGELKGMSYFIASRLSQGVAIDNRIYLQYMDVNESIAKNIAKVLTTNGLLDGEPMSTDAKLAYYETFLSNKTERNHMKVKVVSQLGQNVLVVTLIDPISKEQINLDLNSKDAEKMITDHLMSANKYTKRDGSIQSYPASMSYMKGFSVGGAIQKGIQFTDYEFTTNTKGNIIVKEVKKDYFDFIKPLAKVDYTSGEADYFVGINAYLSFATPFDLETPADQLIDLGMPIKNDIKSKNIDNGLKTKKPAPVDEEVDEETGTKFSIETTQSSITNDKTLVANINEADGVFGLGTNFKTKDEKVVEERAGREDKWYGVTLGTKKNAPKDFKPSADSINQMVKNLSQMKGNVINIVGNDIAELSKQGYSQADIDKYIYNILSEIVKQFPISKIISNGQTGVAEASIKAAKRLGIPVKIRAFSGYQLRTAAPYLASGYKTNKNLRADFLSRFFSKSSKTYKKAAAKVVETREDKTTTVPKTAEVKGRTVEIKNKSVEEQKVEDAKINRLAIDDLLDGSDIIPDVPLNRDKRKAGVMNQLYGKQGWEQIQNWWKNSPLKGVVDVERLALVFNSDAYATFMSAGSMLADAAVKLRQEGFVAKIELYGDALPITLYHEAWHAFSQLVLTKEEKTKLYETIRTYDKWKNMEYIDIEEELAEEFIDYAVNGRKQKGFIQTIFDKIKKIIEFFFGNTTKRDVTRLQDIPKVKEYFDKLYTGKFEISTQNAENNLMAGFQRLNSAKKTIQPVEVAAKAFSEITDVESSKIVDLMDSLMARTFYLYNSKFSTTSGAVKLLSDINNRQKLYNNLKKQLSVLLDNQIEVARNIALKNAEIDNENPDYITEQKENAKLQLLLKAFENFGDIDASLSKQTDVGVVAFHMQRSRFNILKDAYIDDTEDASVALFKSTEGNAISAKQLATDDTMMMLSGIYKLKRDDQGNYIQTEDEAGVKSYSIEEDDFGLPILEPVDIMWNRLARTMQGSLDYAEMYDRLRENIENYPEFIQVMQMLPNPYLAAPGSYNNTTEFQSETNFWQDLKKPVIPFVQLNINKTVLEKAKKIDGKWIPEKSKYESRLAAANFDIYRIINDWTTNFNVADPATNKFVVKDGVDNYLDTAALMKEFTQKKQLIPSKAAQFLAALGIQLDMTSAEIKAIVNNKKKPFSSSYNIDFIYNNVRMVHLAGKSDDIGLQAAAAEFKRNPLYYLLNGLPDAISKAAGDRATDVKTKIRALAELQNRFSDGYSNYSVLTPEKNKVWEQFLDNTITRVVTSINRAKNWQQLTMDEADPNGRFQHMRWLGEDNNPASAFSVILNSVFDLNPMSNTYGEKFPDASIVLENIGGTQIINKETNDSIGTSTANTDVTSKFLQELHTMLQSGVQEFMRHASKQTAMNLRAKKVNTYSSKKADNLYVDVMAFSPANTTADNNLGESQAFNILLGYIAAEGGRIFRFKSPQMKDYFAKFTSYNRDVIRKDTDSIVKAGEAFTAFDDVLSSETQAELYAIIDRAIEEGLSFEEFNLKDIVNEDPDLRKLIKNDVIDYFDKQYQLNYSRLEDANYVDQSLYEMVPADALSRQQIDRMLVKAYTYNSWIHNFETTILAYGDAAQYNHDKEEFHKRNAGLGSGGRGFRADFRARAYINSPMFQRLYAEKQGYKLKAYDGTLTSAIIKEEEIKESVYKPEYYDAHVKEYTERFTKAGKSKAEAKRMAEELAEIVLGEYDNMKVADGQGWLNFEAYRMLKKLEGSWKTPQDNLYKRVVAGEQITASEIEEFFPPYKLQYYGNIKTEGLPLTSFHKFSLAPLIPSVHTANTRLGQIHDMMLKQNVDYVLMETGEKVGHIGSGDVITDANGNIDSSVQFTKNVIFAEYLKNQTEVNSKYKAKSIFSTQLRKLILEGLYEQGEITSKDPKVRQLVTNYINRVSEYTELLKNELIDELGFEETESGEFVPKDKDAVAKLAKMIRENLTRDDVLSDNLIDIIDVTEEGEMRFDLSLHPEAVKIEKLLLSLINKRIIKQKVKGEPLVQKSSAFYEGLFDSPVDFEKMDKKTRAAAVKKYMGSNFLPTYHKKTIDLEARYKNADKEKLNEALKTKERVLEEQAAYWTDRNKQALRDEIQYLKDKIAGRKPKVTTTTDGYTTAMKVAISLQGDYENLLNLDYQGEPISTIDRLNQAIKDDEWLDENNGANRKAITMVGVRIPVQGLNSMEFMEVYHFLPAEAGNIIIPPAEIVAKSGADFDIDKLSIFMNNIDSDGNILQAMFENSSDFYEALKDPSKYEMTKAQMYAMQKAGLENNLINDIRSILELPQNFVSLTTPNGTYLVKPTADRLAQYVMDYSPLQNMMSDTVKKSAPDKKGKQKDVISPTRIFEVGYNLYKHESNVVGKKTLGLGAIENTFNVVFNSLGATMPAVYKHSKEEQDRVSFLGLRHNTVKKNGQDVISLSNQYDVDGINKIADIINQLINGWVDVEKDAWVFFVQGNYEVAPVLLYLLKTGVPFKEAVYFVSQPLVRQYVKEKRLGQSTFAEPLRKEPGFQGASFKAASDVIAKNFEKFIPDNQTRYEEGMKVMENYFDTKKRKNNERHFTEEEMLKLIEDSKTNPELGASELSRAMFLHYLTIEQQIQGLTALKMASNPDTSTMTDVGQAIQAEANMDALAEESKIDQDLRLGLLNDSVISSFFNTKLIRGLSKPLFKFRYDEDIQDYIQSYMGDIRNSAILKAAFGRNYRDKFPVTFRNDILSYIFQNALRKYNLGNEYSSFALTDSMSLTLAAGLKFGAQVVETSKGPTMVIDRVQLEKEFFDKAYLKGSEARNSYEQRGLYALEPGHFGSNTSSNKAEYIRFVIEREYLRHLMPYGEVSKTKEYEKELELANKTSISDKEAVNRRYAYEKILAMRALDNTLNPYHLFNDRDNAYAIRFDRLRSEYRNDFVKDYPVLARIVPDSTTDKTMFNLYVDDKDMSTFKSNLYSRNLQDLADRTVKKVQDKAENDRISDFFAKMTYVAMMQAGTNKSKYNFLNLTDFDKFIDIMNDETAKFLTSPAKLKMLIDFKNKFEQVNSQTNRTRSRFKNYLTGLDVEKIEARSAVKAIKPKKGVEELFNENPELANQVYSALGFKSKPDVILPIGTSGSGKSTFIKSLPQENLVVIEPDAMRVEFTGDINDKSKDKEIYEEAAKRAVAAIKQGKQVVFDTTNLTKDKRLPFIEAIKKALPNANIQYKLMELNPELAKQRIKAQIERGENRANVSDETIDRHAKSYKQMLEDIKNEPISNFEIAPQQKQQALQVYSQYLDTIFPDRLVREIVYHGTGEGTKIEKLRDRSYFSDLLAASRYAAWDVKNRQAYAFEQGTLENLNVGEQVIPAIINLKNPKYLDNRPYSETEKSYKGHDGIYSTNTLDPLGGKELQIVVNSSKQIHELGTKKDIAMFKQFVKEQASQIDTQTEDVSDSDNLLERKNVIPTINPNVFVYNDLSGTEKAYQYIVDNNQDLTFVYQFSLGQKQALDKMTDAEFQKKKVKGNLQIRKIANSSSIGIITGQDSIADAFSTLDSKLYPKRKAEIEQAINEIRQVVDNGGKVAFSINGYGDPALMPQELFVYLSKRLFEEFQYLNPGSEFAQEISKEVAKYQPVTDAEILANFEGENNPLKC
jgi:predicted kinase